ncbi:alpha-tubulin N-acetyltransferase 1-like [Galendromus occidentalis]|uniref:Alpha-tubulin N-acetyltransferase 1-like n=1 Tax=Galendromus occidentalis TaxID=34638 RepID=A0AAJ6QNJ2_9ACAR|nr:alpha-tubulin N-acetyltransferase 1-like [Galendromus occidentalis]
MSSSVQEEQSFQKAVGFLKVGWKHLLLQDEVQRTYEMTVLCALDFYVQQKHRRLGYGKKLFDCMLLHEGRRPWDVPVDNPSLSCRRFLRKHFNLSTQIPQMNKFAIFFGFPFPPDKRRRERSGNASAEDFYASKSCTLKFFQDIDDRDDFISKSSSWRVLGLEAPLHDMDELSQ